MVRLLVVVCCLWFVVGVVRAAEVGSFVLPNSDVGTTVDLSGKWFFKPTGSEKEAAVPVPQMLSRIQWWLDDSEDFKKWEQARLDALGIDTEKTDDGTYRAVIDVPELPKDRHLWIEFDGVAMQCKVAVNGQPVGEHKGMFSRFGFDLTPHLKVGKNELTVWVSMEKIPPTSAQLGEAVTVNLSAAKVISMSKGMFGPLTVAQDNRAYDLLGIWQPVKLVVRGTAKINDVFFEPKVDGYTLHVDYNGGEQPVAVKWKFTGADGKVLREGTHPADANVKGPTTFQQGDSLPADQQPKLWTPAEPNLYQLDVTLESADGQVLDKWSRKVGFRTFEVKGNQLLLNGKPYFLRGANQLPYGKNPWDPAVARHLIKQLHDANVNSTRTHATPWNEVWLDAADEIGLGVSIEGIRPWAFAGKAAEGKPTPMPSREIMDHWLMENADVVKRCRNHPSVIIFTVGNEMLLRDGKNIEKWKLLSEVVKQTRGLAPRHPIVCSSDYTRDPEFYESTLKPGGIDDGDIDDMHRYNGWYAGSGFTTDAKFEKEAKQNGGTRPLIGQEFATGYPDLDNGLPVLRYTRDLLTPQAWVGNSAYPGNDPSPWLKEHAKVTKRWAEMLRWQRGTATAGFSLFSAECWFKHSWLPEATAYPTLAAVKDAYQPVGVALETPQRRFWGGQEVSTAVLITNDDAQFRNFDDLTISIDDTFSGRQAVIDLSQAKLAHIDYYQTVRVPVRFKLEQGDRRNTIRLAVSVQSKGQQIAQTIDEIELFPKPTGPSTAPAGVLVVKRGEKLTDEQRKAVEGGATAIWFSPAKEIAAVFPEDLLDSRGEAGEYVDFAPCAGTKLAEGLQPLDLKWWSRKDDWRAFVIGSSQRLKPGGKARELIRYIPPHGYIAADKVPEQYRAAMCEIPMGKGRVWICNLDLDASVDVDPIARIFADNLYRAAADPESTKNLPVVPPHAELLKGVKK